jgi:CheY-like chemotaxis protein
LGLAVVHGIIKNHRGVIQVASTVGEGTIADVFLPVCEEGVDQKREQRGPLPRGSERILFVDDEPILVTLCDAMFKKLGYQACSVMDSRDALEIFTKDPGKFDLVITDLTMPALTGIELSERISKIRPDIPVILCTGFGDQLDREQLKTIGIVEMIFKPPVIEDMALAIRRALNENHTRE